MFHKVCSRQSVFVILCAERMRQKTDGKLDSPHDQCRGAALTPVNPCRRIWNTTNDQRTQETFKLILPSRRRWHPCQSIGQLAQLMQPTRKPSTRLHVRADLPAMTESPTRKGSGKKSTPKNLQSIRMRFKMYASSRQLVMQTPILLSYFSMPVWRTTFEKTVEKSNSLRCTAWLSCKACLSMVWFATSPL